MIERIRDDLRLCDDGRLRGSFGRYENLSPFETWCAVVILEDDGAEESDGATEYGAYFARCGRVIASVDSQGFHYVEVFANVVSAEAAYNRAADGYSKWLQHDDDCECSECRDEFLTREDDAWPAGLTVTVAGYAGVAWYVLHVDTRGPRVAVCMVGDDRTFHFEPADLTRIDRDDYCAECGQVGCYGDFRTVEDDA